MSKKLIVFLSSFLLAASMFFVSIAPASAATVSVKMGSDGGMLQFDPPTVTIKAGDTVQWVNNKMFPHNVIFEDSSVEGHKDMMFAAGETFETTFSNSGEYSYYCAPHRGAGMQGKVVVQ